MHMNPKISVITPSYNQGVFIEETIKSVVDQCYPNLEYIIIDGGSTDDSAEIIKRYESNLSYWISEKDSGQSNAINKGFARVTGDILAWINSDDTYNPHAFHIVAEYFVAHPEVDFLYGDVNIIDQHSKVRLLKKELDFDFTMGCCIGFGIIISQQAAFWRRRVYDKIGGLREDLHYNMDGDFFFRVAANGFTLKHIEISLANYRRHESAKTSTHLASFNQQYNSELMKSLEALYHYLPISRFIPFRYSAPFRKIYRLKRFTTRLLKGHKWEKLSY